MSIGISDKKEAQEWLKNHIIVDEEIPEGMIFAYDPSRMWIDFDTQLIHLGDGVLVRTTGKICIKK